MGYTYHFQHFAIGCVFDRLSYTILKDDERENLKQWPKNSLKYSTAYDICTRVCDRIKDNNIGCYVCNGRGCFVWNGSAVLFSYLCWYVTAIFEKNGLRMYKGEGKSVDYKAFNYFLNTPKKINRKAVATFKEGAKPPKYANAIKEGTKEVLADILNKPIVNL